MKYPLASSSWDHKEIEALKEVINSGNLTMGEKVYAFEKDMAKFLGSKYCVMVNSGSSANLLAIASLFYKKESALAKGDEVIVPAVSWSTTYIPLLQYDLKLKFVDVDIETLNMDVSILADAISSNTKAIFAVNLLGNPNEFKQLNEICNKHNLILLEDNCESLGATFRGQKTGTFGKIGTFSTFFSHHISTMEGGGCVTDDEEIYHILLSLRSHGWTRNLPNDNFVSGKKQEDSFEEYFKFVLPGFNLRPIELSAAIGIEQLKKLPSMIKVRRDNASVFYSKMKRFSDMFHLQKEVGESSFFGFPIILKNGTASDRASLVSELNKHQIEVRPIVAGNFTKHPVIKYFDYSVHGELSNADKIHDLGFFIGNHYYNLEREINHFVSVLERWI